MEKKQGQDTMTAFSAETGKTLWAAPHPWGGHDSPEDLLIVDGLAWSADNAEGNAKGTWIGRDVQTGEVKKEIPQDIVGRWFHHRVLSWQGDGPVFCSSSRGGIECVDIANKHWDANHWIRSSCLYGVMPANGFIYTGPHPCACYAPGRCRRFQRSGRRFANAAGTGRTSRPTGGWRKGPAFNDVKAVEPDER